MKNENIIIIGDKQINCSKLSDEALIKLYYELEKREKIIEQKIQEYQKKYPQLKNIKID